MTRWTWWRLVGCSFAAAVVVACGPAEGGSRASAADAPAYGRGRALPPPPPPPLPPPGNVCASPPGSLPAPDKTPRVDDRPPAAGLMTEQAAQAKRQFDGEHWEAAVPALQEVVNGHTHDDPGVRELADYWMAIALYRTNRLDESVERFRAIAHRPSHIRFSESLAWLVRIARQHRERFLPTDLVEYGDASPKGFDNANQQDVFGAVHYLLGQLRYDQGDLEGAERHFAIAATHEPWPHQAEWCLKNIALTRAAKADGGSNGDWK